MPTYSIESLLDAMTLEEQVSLLSGHDNWSTPSINRLNIGELRVTDGPNGARGGGTLFGGVKAACFPCGIALGATWNTSLMYDIGSAIADEVKSKGAHVLLGPTINMQRTATNGRNFECFSEDAVLTADLSTEYIKGLQSQGVAATVKHFVGNESEFERTTMSSDIDERTLREHYLYPFEKVVKEGGAWGVMTSYNRLNGTYTSEHPWLLKHVLREQWRFDGILMSDWFGSHSTKESIEAGLTLEMPGPTRDRGAKLVAAVKDGRVSPDTVRDLAREMLVLLERTGVIQSPTTRVEVADNRPEHQALIRKAGAEATVLLKNDAILPINRGVSVAVIGPNAKTAQIMGGGSAQLNPHYTVSPLEGLITQLGSTAVSYARGCNNRRYEPLLMGEFTASYFNNLTLSGEAVHTQPMSEVQDFIISDIGGGKVSPNNYSIRIEGEYVAQETAIHHIGAYAAGFIRVYVDDNLIVDAWGDKWQRGSTYFEEGCNEVVGEFPMEVGQHYRMRVEFRYTEHCQLDVSGYRVGVGRPTTANDIHEAVNLAKQADVAVLCVGRNGEWDTEGGDLPHIQLPGHQDELVKAVAVANPNTIVVLQTGGPIEMPWLDNVKAVIQSWYGGQEVGNAIADVLLGTQEPSGRLPQTFPVRLSDNPMFTGDPLVYPGVGGHVVYKEGELFGYRHYDKNEVEPLFPFGFGLSYTTFEINSAQIKPVDDGYSLITNVSNTGERDGTAVVQVYIEPVASEQTSPQSLKAFAKHSIDLGSSMEITLPISLRDLAYFDIAKGNWRVEAGEYVVNIGFSSRDIKATQIIKIAETINLPA